MIVGSGFGGSVMAYRLAEAGQRVLVLERGKPYPPGSFPRSPRELARAFWDPSEGLHGMFDLWSFDGLESLVASGLGGGSLIYANVLIRKDPKWFAEGMPGSDPQPWPIGYEDLEPHYELVEKMLGATPYPFEKAPYDSTPKTIAYKEAAENLGQDWRLPNLAVSFAPRPGDEPVPGEPLVAEENIHGRTRQTCRLVGECDVGCNFGAKNSLDYTYLTAAWKAGAEIRTSCEVRAFEPREGGGYAAHYVSHDPEREQPAETGNLPRTTVTADRLVLAAGTLGSTYLLLRNRAAFPGLSQAQLGTRFSGNGDLLTFAVRCSQTGADGKRKPRLIDPGFGPVITSAIRVPDRLDGEGTGRGFYLEDAGFPEFGNWLLQGVESPTTFSRMAPVIVARLVRRLLGRDRDTSLSAEVSALFGDSELSAGVLPLLGMGRDTADGRMGLDGGRLQVDWTTDTSAEYFDRVRELSRQIAEQLGAEFQDNPLWFLKRVVTVHPLGGCPMGAGAERGVVDSNGEVFGHPGFHVADGSVMPGPVGPNPSLTIAAVANRAAEAILEGKTSDPPARPPRPVAPRPSPSPRAAEEVDGAPRPPGRGGVSVAFTEEMKGFVALGEEDFEPGQQAGEDAGTRFMFQLTITAADLDRFVADPDHLAGAEGYVECEALGGRLPVERGLFNLFVDLDGDKRNKRMLYRLHFADGEGHPLTMTGFKVVEDDPGIDNVWADTSTLFTRVLAGHVDPAEDDSAEILAAGILHIEPFDFLQQMTTFDTEPDGRVDAVARFGRLFAGELWDVYGPGSGSGR